MKIHRDIEQWTQERFNLRKLKMTASKWTAIGNCWKWLDTYTTELVVDSISTAEKTYISNKDTDRGHELEPLARSLYEMETWNDVEEVGFIEYNDYVWCSPDWLVWDDGGVEIKCLNDKKHFEMIIWWADKIESWYMRQIQMCLLITGREWWDYVGYNPNFKESLLIHRIYPDKDKQKKLLAWFEYGENKIKELLDSYNKKWD